MSGMTHSFRTTHPGVNGLIMPKDLVGSQTRDGSETEGIHQYWLLPALSTSSLVMPPSLRQGGPIKHCIHSRILHRDIIISGHSNDGLTG